MKQTTISLIVSICIYQVPILFRIYDYILNGELSFCVVFSSITAWFVQISKRNYILVWFDETSYMVK